MKHTATAAVRRYWKEWKNITFEGSDKQAIYDLLTRADDLIERLDEELCKLVATPKAKEVDA